MWEDFGVGYTGESNTAISIAGYDGLSECQTAYWWASHDLNIGGKIAKDSPEGRGITRMVKGKASEKMVIDSVFEIALGNMIPHKIAITINYVRERSFKSGEDSKAREIKRALGIRQ